MEVNERIKCLFSWCALFLATPQPRPHTVRHCSQAMGLILLATAKETHTLQNCVATLILSSLASQKAQEVLGYLLLM